MGKSDELYKPREKARKKSMATIDAEVILTEPTIDLEAALNPQGEDDPLYIYNNSIGDDKVNNKVDDNLLLSSSDIELISIEINSIEFKQDFTEREKKFLELYLSGNITQDAAVMKAGYKSKFKQNRALIGKRIVEKYCSSIQDHKIIFRQIGFSEAKLGIMLLNMAENAKSENVRLQALNLASKCLGMHREVIEGLEGFKMVFEDCPAPTKAEPPKPQPALPAPQEQEQPVKRLVILK